MRVRDQCLGKQSVSLKHKGKCPKSIRITGTFVCRLDSLNVFSLPALWSLGHVKLHSLPFLQAAKTASLNSGKMHEDIVSALTANEAIAFGVVKPLYCSLFH